MKKIKTQTKDGVFRKCFKCKKILPIDNFYKHKGKWKKLGYFYDCKSCHNIITSLSKRSESELAKQRIRNKKVNRIKERERLLKYYWENHEKVLAQAYIKNRVKKGIIKRKPCIICGKPNAIAHHSDYDKRGHIFWLCQKHHVGVHRKYDPIILNPSLAFDY